MVSIQDKTWIRWDGTTYQGMSLLAVSYLFNRFSYSLVWCNKVNCIGVRDDALGIPLRRPAAEFSGARLDQHPCDKERREMAVISPDGTWKGDSDKGKGSPHIRQTQNHIKSYYLTFGILKMLTLLNRVKDLKTKR